jgi:serine/threonine protein phosphatase PrpC
MNLIAGYKTDIGRKRKQNQDNGISVPDLGLFIVADGMGGHQGGETASAMVVESVPAIVKKKTKKKNWDPKVVLAEAIREANSTIYKKASEQNTLQGMGTTTTSLLFSQNILTLGHVGDSRCYYIRENAIWQLTRDHSLVAEKIRAGLITPEEARTDQMKNVITRSVGFESHVDVDTYEFEVQNGDVFLVCSDGLSGFLEDDKMLELITPFCKEQKSIDETLQSLIDGANNNGGEDNISALLVKVTGI